VTLTCGRRATPCIEGWCAGAGLIRSVQKSCAPAYVCDATDPAHVPKSVLHCGCDYGVRCEKAGHYVGFRTAEESRAIREGHAEVCDLRD
jgi:hypothetical protein